MPTLPWNREIKELQLQQEIDDLRAALNACLGNEYLALIKERDELKLALDEALETVRRLTASYNL